MLYTINLPIAPWKIKISPGASICRAYKGFFPAQINSSGCVSTLCFRNCVPVLSFSQETIMTFASHFRLFTKLLNYISLQNHHEPLGLN